MPILSRRSVLQAAAALAVLPALRRAAHAAPPRLVAGTRVLDIGGKAATIMGLVGPDGRSGVRLGPDERFRLTLENRLAEPTLIHWHGQIPPNLQDGVPDAPLPALSPGETRDYDYAAMSGSFWMHSHIPVQEIGMLAAPLIVQSAEDLAADRQEVVLFLHDFSFTPPAELLASVLGAMPGMDHGSGMAMDHTAMGHGTAGGAMAGMDLNDIEFDAYLANDRTLDDPEVVTVERGGRLRLRVINAAAATTFWINCGALPATLVAVDGHPVVPRPGGRWGLSMAQRIDLDIAIPGPGPFPILAHREGGRERTGIILAPPRAEVRRLAGTGEEAAPAFDTDLAQERGLTAATPLPDRPAAKSQTLMLTGAMSPYQWTIDGQVYGSHVPAQAQSGERVEITFHNMSGMGHPMHLHGHVFQVVAVNGQRFAGAVRDTVYVPPAQAVTIAIDAGEAARWMLHCHQMPHLASGMMTEFVVSA